MHFLFISISSKFFTASKQKSVRLADESRFVPNSSTMTGASERPSRLRPDDRYHKTRNTNNSHSHRTHGKKNIAESPRVPSTAPGFVERALSLKAMKTNNVTVKNAYMNVSSRTTTAQKGAILKLPKFSKNTFSSNLDPHFGASHSEWVNSFTEASTATFANDT